MKPENALLTKSYAFALRMVRLQQFLAEQKKEYVLSRQVVRSGTSIGANLEEANQAESLADFIHKLSLSNKEAHETHYWLRLLRDAEWLDNRLADSLLADCGELIGMLTASLKTNKRKQAMRLGFLTLTALLPLLLWALS